MEEARAEWAIQRPLRDAARKARKLVYPIPTNQLEAYYKAIKDVEAKLKSSPSPAMPVVATYPVASALSSGNERAGRHSTHDPHREKVEPSIHTLKGIILWFINS